MTASHGPGRLAGLLAGLLALLVVAALGVLALSGLIALTIMVWRAVL